MEKIQLKTSKKGRIGGSKREKKESKREKMNKEQEKVEEKKVHSIL